MIWNSVSKTALPQFDTDDAARRIVAEADLTGFDLLGGIVVQYELEPKSAEAAVKLPLSNKAGND